MLVCLRRTCWSLTSRNFFNDFHTEQKKVKTKENKGERNRKQECIPVGCVPTTAVAATRCQQWGGGGWADPPEGVSPSETDSPVNRQMLLKTLTFHAVGINKKYPLLVSMGSYAYRHNAS